MFLVRDINDLKIKELEAQREKQKLILELQEKNGELFELGMTDSLTGIYNRAGLNYYSASILEKAKARNMNVFLLIADIYMYKEKNLSNKENN